MDNDILNFRSGKHDGTEDKEEKDDGMTTLECQSKESRQKTRYFYVNNPIKFQTNEKFENVFDNCEGWDEYKINTYICYQVNPSLSVA